MKTVISLLFAVVMGCASSGTVPAEMYERSVRAQQAAEQRARAADALNRRLIANAGSVAADARPRPPVPPGVPAATLPSAPVLGPMTPVKTAPRHPSVAGWNQVAYQPSAVGTPYLLPRPYDWGADPRSVARIGQGHGACNARDTILIRNNNRGIRMDVEVTFQNAWGQTLAVYPEALVPPWGDVAVCPPDLREIGAHATSWQVHYEARYCEEEGTGECVELPAERHQDSRVPFRPYANAPYVLGAEMPW